MRALTETEVQEVSGGFSVFGITEIRQGLKIMGQVSSVVKYATASFGIGYAAGTIISNGYEYLMGDTIGGDVYDFFHC